MEVNATDALRVHDNVEVVLVLPARPQVVFVVVAVGYVRVVAVGMEDDLVVDPARLVLEPQRNNAAPAALIFLFAVDALVLIFAPVLQSALVLVKHPLALTPPVAVVDVNVSNLGAFDHQKYGGAFDHLLLSFSSSACAAAAAAACALAAAGSVDQAPPPPSAHTAQLTRRP
jgi:hypothetical protein